VWVTPSSRDWATIVSQLLSEHFERDLTGRGGELVSEVFEILVCEPDVERFAIRAHVIGLRGFGDREHALSPPVPFERISTRRECSIDGLVTQCPTHHSWIGWFGEPPLACPNQALDGSGQLATIEIANSAGFQYRNHGQRALDAAMDALWIAMVKMRSHDAKRQVPLDALIELGPAKSLAQCLLAGNKQGAANERADRRP